MHRAFLAGYVVDYRSVGPETGFVLKDPASLHSIASDPGRVRLSEAGLREFARGRGYKQGWVFHRLREQMLAVLAESAVNTQTAERAA